MRKEELKHKSRGAEGVSEDSGRGPSDLPPSTPGAARAQAPQPCSQVQEVGAGNKLSRAALYTAVV